MNGTAIEPPWVIHARQILEGSDNLTSSAVPISGDYQPQILENEDVTLGTLRQEKDTFSGAPHGHAGFTCTKCPVPWRRLEGGAIGDPIIVGKEAKKITPRKWLNTKRCKKCNSKMKRWQNSQNMGTRIKVVKHLNEGSFIAFVTLTIPNIPDDDSRESLPDEIRKLKKKVQKFRRRKSFEESILGGVDAFENTVRPDGSWNIHHHGIWVMNKYWSQKDFQDQWGFRTRIEKVRKEHAVLKYLTSYVSKQKIEGVRCLETFRQCRGRAYDALYESAVLRK